VNIKVIYFFLVFFIYASCVSEQKQKDITALINNPLSGVDDLKAVKVPIIELDQDIFDFSEIYQHESVSNDFLLRNVGDAPLLIRSAKGSCGCMIPEWPKEIIEIGDEAIVKVTFNSGERKGKQNKTVTLVTNAIPSVKVLKIKGTVLVPEI